MNTKNELKPMAVTVSTSAYGYYDPQTKHLTLQSDTKEEELSYAEFEDKTLPPLRYTPRWDWDAETITRNQFMDFFRDTDGKGYHYTVTNEDKIEVFLNCLSGSSDLTRTLLEELCNNYGTTLNDVYNDFNQ